MNNLDGTGVVRVWIVVGGEEGCLDDLIVVDRGWRGCERPEG